MNNTPTLEQLHQQRYACLEQYAQVHVDIQATEDHLAKLRQRAGLLLDDARALSDRVRKATEEQAPDPETAG